MTLSGDRYITRVRTLFGFSPQQRLTLEEKTMLEELHGGMGHLDDEFSTATPSQQVKMNERRAWINNRFGLGKAEEIEADHARQARHKKNKKSMRRGDYLKLFS